MVEARPAHPATTLERLAALPLGARLLTAVEGLRAGPRLHLVGGAVRDLLLDRTPAELDLVAERDAPAVALELARALDGEARVHARFATASVALGDGARVDLATARAETYPRPGALPEVRVPAPLDADLARRDFTVNAIAVALAGGAWRAAEHALDDLAAGRLRVLHPASFLDDPTRLVRLARYAARLGMRIETETERLARAALDAGAPATAGPARIGHELVLLLSEPTGIEGLALLQDLAGGTLDAVLPPSESFAPPAVLHPDRVRRARDLLPGDGRPAHLVLAALLAGRARADVEDALRALHVAEPAAVLDAAGDPAALAGAMRAAARPSELHALLHRRAPEAVALAGAHDAEEPARRWLGELRHVRLSISGADLLAAGVAPGPEIGRRLGRALAARLDGGARTRDEELAAALASEA